jgi:hypothetical protein
VNAGIREYSCFAAKRSGREITAYDHQRQRQNVERAKYNPDQNNDWQGYKEWNPGDRVARNRNALDAAMAKC